MNSDYATTRIFQSWLTVVDDKTLREIWQHITGLSHDTDSSREWVVREIIRLAPQGIWKEYPEVVEEIDRYYETKATFARPAFNYTTNTWRKETTLWA